MLLNYVSEDLEKFAADFYNTTGINIRIIDKNFNPLKYKTVMRNSYCNMIQSTDEGAHACVFSDVDLVLKCRQSMKTEVHVCHAGLIDIAVPIINENSIIGYILLGQIKSEKDFFASAKKFSKTFPDMHALKDCYDALEYFDDKKINSMVNIITMLAGQLPQNILKIKTRKNIEDAVDYINNNLEKRLTVQTISKAINISKSTLYDIFHSYFNCTVSEFINRKRINKSIALLTGSELSIEEISYKTGFSSAAYYSRVFKKLYKISPHKFRKYNNQSKGLYFEIDLS